jgi:hypothetical protein
MKLVLALFLTIPIAANAQSKGASTSVPQPIRACLNDPAVKGLEILVDKPRYLRGDFDGDGKLDYVVQMKSKKLGGIGLVICRGAGVITVLGKGIGGQTFSDMPEDRFLASIWKVYTKRDISLLSGDEPGVHPPVPSGSAVAIAMIWEDGIGLVYWDGTKFRWAGNLQ